MSTPRSTNSPFRIIVMGTGPFAVPTFRALLDSQYEVLALVTRPDRPAHRREKLPANPMREVGESRGLEIFEPDSINSPAAQAWLQAKGADLFVVCDYGQILSRETLALARLGGINLHASLLPKYRGAAPINWAIYEGEQETGVTVIHMTPQLDGGPALVQMSTPIGNDETAPQLEARLSMIGVKAVMDAIHILATGQQTTAAVQDPQLATKAPRLKKEDGHIDWSRSAKEIFNQVRAFQPWPKSYTFVPRGSGEPVRLILETVRPIEAGGDDASGLPEAPPGTVVQSDSANLVVACGLGKLQIESLQPAGKRVMSAAEFLRGFPLKVGDRLQ